MTVLLPAIAPIALIILIGFAVGHTLSLDQQTLSQLSIYVLVPALITSSLYHTTLSTQSAVSIALGFTIIFALLYAMVQLLSRILRQPILTRKSLVATTLYANTGNMGLPFIAFSLGEAGLERAVVYLIVGSIFMASLGPALLQGSGLKAGIRLTLRLPLVWAMVLGIGLRLFAIQLPLRLDQGLDLLGQAAIPVALIMLGIQLAKTRLEFSQYEFLATGLRLLLAPALAYTIGRILGLTGLELKVLILQGAMPAAVNSLVWVTEFGGDTARVAKTIVLSTLLSFLTLPCILWLIQFGTL